MLLTGSRLCLGCRVTESSKVFVPLPATRVSLPCPLCFKLLPLWRTLLSLRPRGPLELPGFSNLPPPLGSSTSRFHPSESCIPSAYLKSSVAVQNLKLTGQSKQPVDLVACLPERDAAGSAVATDWILSRLGTYLLLYSQQASRGPCFW